MRNQQEFVELIDRYRLGEARRLAIGLSIQTDFSCVDTALALTEGRGKCLRPRWLEHRQSPIGPGVAQACVRFAERVTGDIEELAQLRNDLSMQLAESAGQAITISGRSEKKLLAICVNDPGIWLRDYDGAISWEPLVSAATLAARTGLSVIDGLPMQDLASGGRGWPLAPLAWWMMFADRPRTVARTARVVVHWTDQCHLVWLPESDGLDNEIPGLRQRVMPGAGLERQLLARCGQGGLTAPRRDGIGAQGRINEELAAYWQSAMAAHRVHPADESNDGQILEESFAIIHKRELGIADVLRTFSHQLAGQVAGFIDEANHASPVELVAGGALNSHGLLMNEIRQAASCDWFADTSFNYRPPALDAATTAMFGLMHIDQMPVSVPWLTGCEFPRVAGRLTPGSPASFRRLIMEMGDSQPPVMKLREAV